MVGPVGVALPVGCADPELAVQLTPDGVGAVVWFALMVVVPLALWHWPSMLIAIFEPLQFEASQMVI